ncbi:MAG: ABC-type cobalt transport system, ATPase component [uncultured archaeon A07HR60]|nr:MAG: ABC-type cobalt transport system, ATPase component [uncultured archaeon A07HR60]
MIEARDVLVTYDDTVAVDRVSLTIPDGQWVILAGANGSGKTSLVRTFNGLVSVESGEVAINGTPVTEDLVAARTAVAMVFQHPRDQIVAPTVEGDVAFGPANLGLSRESIQDRVRESLAAVEMTGRESARIDALSGGERARVAIAGALAMQPDHLVLDEPFAGLDESARFAVLDRLERYQPLELGS